MPALAEATGVNRTRKGGSYGVHLHCEEGQHESFLATAQPKKLPAEKKKRKLPWRFDGLPMGGKWRGTHSIEEKAKGVKDRLLALLGVRKGRVRATHQLEGRTPIESQKGGENFRERGTIYG